MGEAGLVEQSSAEAKSLKLRAKGLSGCHPSGQKPRQPDGGLGGQNKKLILRQLLKKQSLKQLWLEELEGLKATRQRMHNDWKKERRLLYAPILKLQKGVMFWVMRLLMNKNQKSQSQVHVTA